MGLKVLSVAYPFAPVTADPAGGAEQVLAQIDRALVAAGHCSRVIAPEGSAIAGELVAVHKIDGDIGEDTRFTVHAEIREALACAVRTRGADIIHLRHRL